MLACSSFLLYPYSLVSGLLPWSVSPKCLGTLGSTRASAHLPKDRSLHAQDKSCHKETGDQPNNWRVTIPRTGGQRPKNRRPSSRFNPRRRLHPLAHAGRRQVYSLQRPEGMSRLTAACPRGVAVPLISMYRYSLASGLMPWNITPERSPHSRLLVIAHWSPAAGGGRHRVRYWLMDEGKPDRLDVFSQALASRGSVPDACLYNPRCVNPCFYPAFKTFHVDCTFVLEGIGGTYSWTDAHASDRLNPLAWSRIL